MSRQDVKFAVPLVVLLILCNLASARQSQKALTNDDVVAMVKNKMAESVVIAAIQSTPTKFDTTASELIRLQWSGVTENELNAMIAASAKGNSSAPSANTVAMPTSKSHMPKAYVSQNGALQELPLEKTQLATTKTKPSSMKNLAADNAVTQAMQAGINTATYTAATHINSGIGGASVQTAGSIFGGMVGHRTPTMTYVWGVPSPASSNVLQTVYPAFSVDFSRIIGVQPDDYEPAIVKLTPAQNTCRIVGATQGKEDEQSSPAADWQIYSHFLEERVTSKSEKIEPGKYKVSPTSQLPPGEYAVVLRPNSKAKSFSGGDVARAQGDGLMFDTVWTFQISESAE